jgi:uncharacterized protein YeaO (DUF488 family)
MSSTGRREASARRSQAARQEVAHAMTIRIVRLGSPRAADEGLRLGTVRRPPRGVPKAEYASRDFYDVWMPDLAPSEALLKQGQLASDDKACALVAALSHQTSFSVGCYCVDETRCHRSILRQLLEEHGAAMAP